ncbi:PTS transporter subunit IIC [Salinivibrio kushneri]|uniref:PTS transporter subunit IIC n=1 Tax=Salinivibrio kushneri TaxID=1908198 RepID=UPI0039EE73BB
MGHFPTFLHVLDGFIGCKLDNKAHVTENMDVPKRLLVLRDTPVAISIICMLTCLFAHTSTNIHLLHANKRTKHNQTRGTSTPLLPTCPKNH